SGISAQDSGNTKVDIPNDISRHDHQVAGMQIGMKHAVTKRVPQKIIDEPPCKDARGKAGAGRWALTGLDLPKILGYRDSLDELNRQNTRGGVTPVHSRYFFMLILFGVAAKFVHVVRFTPIVQFLLRPCYELLGGSNDPIHRP